MISEKDMRRQTAKALTENLGGLLMVGGSTIGGGYLGGKLGRYLTKSQAEQANKYAEDFEKSLSSKQKSMVKKINSQSEKFDLAKTPNEAKIRSITLDKYMLEFTDSFTPEQKFMYDKIHKSIDKVSASVLGLSMIGGVVGLFFGAGVHDLIKSHLKK